MFEGQKHRQKDGQSETAAYSSGSKAPVCVLESGHILMQVVRGDV